MNTAPEKNNDSRLIFLLSFVLIFSTGLLDLYSVELFHTFAEGVSIFIALMASVTIVLSYKSIRNDYLLVLGLGYFWVAVVDLLHTLTFNGFNLLHLTGIPISVQYWILARGIESIVLVFGVLTLYKPSIAYRPFIFFTMLGAIAIFGLWLVESENFPEVFIPGAGLTPFKILTEYLIISVLLFVLFLQIRKRTAMDVSVFNLLTAAIVTTIVAELVFTFYKSPTDLAVIIGHQLKILSFLFIFTAIVRVLLLEPLRVLSRSTQSYDVLPDVILVLDDHGVIRQANRAARELAQIKMPGIEIVGIPMHDVFHDQFLLLDQCPICQHIARPPDNLLEYHDSTTDRIYSVRMTPAKGRQKNNAIIVIARDVSEAKKQQVEMQRLFNELKSMTASIRDIICKIDLQGKVTWCNQAFSLLVKMAEEEVVKSRLSDFVQPDDHNKFDRMLDNARFENHATEILHLTFTGDNILFEFSIAPILNDNGSVVGFTLLGRDVTQQQQMAEYADTLREKLESDVSKRTAELEDINKELEAFSYSVSHDLRAPVRRIAGFVSLLSQASDSLDSTAKDYISRIEKSVLDMNSLIDALLKLSRYNRHQIIKEEVNLSSIAEEIIADLRKEEPALEVAVQIEKNMLVMCDPLLIKVILTNLISNAWKYTRRIRKPEIKIWRVYAAKEDNLSCFCVSDNGIGFEARSSEEIFNAFQRLNRKDEYEGIGIGLATVKRAVVRHGGRVWAESEPDRGARFYFTLDESL